MSLDKDGLKSALLNAMKENPNSKESAMEAMAGALVDYITENLEVKIPDGTVVTSAKGQVVTTRNNITGTGSIKCEVS